MASPPRSVPGHAASPDGTPHANEQRVADGERASAHASAGIDAEAERDAHYANPFAPPDDGDVTRPRSLFGEILDWMLAPLLLLWPMSLAVTYLVAKSIANGPFDRALETDAYVIARQIHSANGVVELTLPPATQDLLRADNIDTVYYQVLGARGELVAGEADMSLPNEDDRPQPGIVEFRDATLRGNDVRIAYTYVDVPKGPSARNDAYALVQVGETLDKRNQLANDIIKGVILPQFVILPLAIVLVWFGLSRGLAPLTALQSSIRARRPDDLSPLEPRRAPPEIAPLVTSFNDLLTRLEQNMDLQKRFIADAAHQMKTPLAGLRTQAELALRQQASEEVHRSLEQIAASSEHAARLVTQLLALARAENRMSGLHRQRLDVVALARQSIHDWVQPALAKRMDLGFEAPDEPIDIEGNPTMLREMLGNLIDNAIRYTPAGGRVTVRVRTDGAPDAAGLAQTSRTGAEEQRPMRELSYGERTPVVHLEVEDTGPGIPESERPRVLERFYRILGRDADGSGLGLAIVSEIVAMHHGSLTIEDHVYQDEPRAAGTLVRVTIPVAPIEGTA